MDVRLGALPGPPQAWSSPPRPVHTAQAKGFPSAHAAFTANAVLAQSPLPHSGTMSSVGPRSHGVGPDWGPRRGGGGRDKDAQLPHVGARWGGVPEEEEGVPGGYFSIFYFQIFFCI